MPRRHGEGRRDGVDAEELAAAPAGGRSPTTWSRWGEAGEDTCRVALLRHADGPASARK